ncbi:MAG TPA: hypothetical protein VES39_02115, partial [Rhodospirillales bacterium]|nr:hypothetical protein [Rhodospirillales bacterium]
DGTLVAEDPDLAVTFVDNHDTWQENRRDEAIREWFLPHAYALILLRQAGTPCVFYPDYYGGGGRNSLRPLLAARRDHAYGTQTDWLDDANLIGWTRAGDADHPRGLAVVITDGAGGAKRMPAAAPGATFVEITGAVDGTVVIDADGTGAFRCNDRSIAVSVQQA